jgi:hypothetical protein
MLEPRSRRVGEVQGQVADDEFIGGGSAQLACQAVVVEPYAGSVSPLYLSIDVGWRKRWGKLTVRISRLNTWVPGGSASVSGPPGYHSAYPAGGGSLPSLVSPRCLSAGR